jgi:hypothetical protein
MECSIIYGVAVTCNLHIHVPVQYGYCLTAFGQTSSIVIDQPYRCYHCAPIRTHFLGRALFSLSFSHSLLSDLASTLKSESDPQGSTIFEAFVG